jgi:hypothetical protein
MIYNRLKKSRETNVEICGEKSWKWLVDGDMIFI